MAKIGKPEGRKGLIFSLDKPPVEPGWLKGPSGCVYTDNCDYSTGLCYATEQECLASNSSSSSSSPPPPPSSSSSTASSSSSSSTASSSSSSSTASSSSSSSTASSSSSGCGAFDTSITTALGSEDNPDLYYVSAVGIGMLTPFAPGTLYYNNLGLSGPALVMDIEISGQIVASLSVSLSYNGLPMAFLYQGSLYCGTFLDGVLRP